MSRMMLGVIAQLILFPLPAFAGDSNPANQRNPAVDRQIVAMVTAEIQRCWNAGPGSANVVTVAIKMNRDGSLAGEPSIVRSTHQGGDRAVTAETNAILSAIRHCQPFKLPIAEYDTWKEIELVFDARPLFPRSPAN